MVCIGVQRQISYHTEFSGYGFVGVVLWATKKAKSDI